MCLDKGWEIPLYGHVKQWEQPHQRAPEIPSSFDQLPVNPPSLTSAVLRGTDQAAIWT